MPASTSARTASFIDAPPLRSPGPSIDRQPPGPSLGGLAIVPDGRAPASAAAARWLVLRRDVEPAAPRRGGTARDLGDGALAPRPGRG